MHVLLPWWRGRQTRATGALGSLQGQITWPRTAVGRAASLRTCFRLRHQVTHEVPTSSFFFKLKVRKVKKIFTNQARKVLSILSHIWLASQQGFPSGSLTPQLGQGEVHFPAFPHFCHQNFSQDKKQKYNILRDHPRLRRAPTDNCDALFCGNKHPRGYTTFSGLQKKPTFHFAGKMCAKRIEEDIKITISFFSVVSINNSL